MGSLTDPTLSLHCLLIRSFGLVNEGIDLFDVVFGSMTWV